MGAKGITFRVLLTTNRKELPSEGNVIKLASFTLCAALLAPAAALAGAGDVEVRVFGLKSGSSPGAVERNATAEEPAPVCGNDVREGTEECDGTAEAACLDFAGVCQVDCTCALPPECGNNVQDGTEVCDGPDDAACPGLCEVDCSCASDFDGDGIGDADDS